jgi:hypothetical protein
MNETMQHVAMRLGAMGFRRQRLDDTTISYPIEQRLKRHRGSRSYRKECGCGAHVTGNDSYEILLYPLTKRQKRAYEEDGEMDIVALIEVDYIHSSKPVPNLYGWTRQEYYGIPISKRHKQADLKFNFDCMNPEPDVVETTII